MKVLTDEALSQGLASLPGWTRGEGGITRAFTFPSYEAGVAFAVHVALHAQRVDHHPDALTIGWQKVRVTYVTHSAGGVTQRDLDAAGVVSSLFQG